MSRIICSVSALELRLQASSVLLLWCQTEQDNWNHTAILSSTVGTTDLLKVSVFESVKYVKSLIM